MAKQRQNIPGSLKDLIDTGLMRVGEELTCEPRRGERYLATVDNDGSIIFEGRRFDTPGGWAREVAGNSRNGWRDVYARGKKLSDFRDRFNSGENPRLKAKGDEEDHPFDVKTVLSEISGLKSQIAHQQSEIRNLNAKIENLSFASPERKTENDIVVDLRERVLNLEPNQFERLVGEYLKAKGFNNVIVSGRSGDGGIDGECAIPFINVKVAFQAKRYAGTNSVGIEPVQRLQGSITGRFDRGIFITTSVYTTGAIEWVEEVQAQITLINGDELMREMISLGLGVKDVTVVKHELDEGFFADLENR